MELLTTLRQLFLTILIVALVLGGGVFLWVRDKQNQAELERDPAWQEQQRQAKAESEERAAIWREKMRKHAEASARKKEAEAAAAAEVAEREHNQTLAEEARKRETEARREADEQRSATLAAARANPEYKMEIATANLYKTGDSDVVLSADLDVHNDNDFPVRDVTVRCALYDRARVETDSYATTICLPIAAHGTRWIPNVRTALFAENSFHASCTVAGATPR